MSLEIGYEAGTKAYSLDVKLFGPIDPTKCALHDPRCAARCWCSCSAQRDTAQLHAPRRGHGGDPRSFLAALTVLWVRVLRCVAAKVDIYGPKVELSLVKADGTNWERLGDVVENREAA